MRRFKILVLCDTKMVFIMNEGYWPILHDQGILHCISKTI